MIPYQDIGLFNDVLGIIGFLAWIVSFLKKSSLL
jgi:hypothetical protein